MTATRNPHLEAAPVLTGAPLTAARAAAVLVHGRDQDEHVMLDLVRRLQVDDVAYVLPVAAGRSWYDGRYFDPVACNQPQLDWALEACEAAIERARRAGLPDGRILVGGFSQGACLVAELIARHPAAFAGVAVMTGALLGPPGGQVRPAPVPDLPMFFSCGREDPWISLADARACAQAFADAGAAVTFAVSEEREHRIDDGAVAWLRRRLAAVSA